MSISLEKVNPGSFRTVAVVGDTVASAFGKPAATYTGVAINVVTQPSGADIFNGLGTGGSDLVFADLENATFASTKEGFYSFTVAATSQPTVTIEIIVFPVLALSVDRIKYATQTDKENSVARPDPERRRILRALAMACTTAGAQAALESSAAVSPLYGTNPVTLAASHSTSMAQFGGW